MSNLPSGPGPGRPPGLANKSTKDARAAIAAFVEANTERLNGLLDRIAEKSPEKAFDCIMAVCEYHIPKLARVENKTTVDGGIKIEIVRLNEPDNPAAK